MRRTDPAIAHPHERDAPGPGAAAGRARPRRDRGFAELVPHDRPSVERCSTSDVSHSTQGGLKMAGKLCVSLTCAKDNTDKATVGFVIANASVGSEQETMVFLSTEGVRLAVKGYADDIHEQRFAHLRAPRPNFAAR